MFNTIYAAPMEDKKKFKPNPDSKLMDQVREVLRYCRYAYRTEQTYCHWIAVLGDVALSTKNIRGLTARLPNAGASSCDFLQGGLPGRTHKSSSLPPEASL